MISLLAAWYSPPPISVVVCASGSPPPTGFVSRRYSPPPEFHTTRDPFSDTAPLVLRQREVRAEIREAGCGAAAFAFGEDAHELQPARRSTRRPLPPGCRRFGELRVAMNTTCSPLALAPSSVGPQNGRAYGQGPMRSPALRRTAYPPGRWHSLPWL